MKTINSTIWKDNLKIFLKVLTGTYEKLIYFVWLVLNTDKLHFQQWTPKNSQKNQWEGKKQPLVGALSKSCSFWLADVDIL